jgi:gliding motility-associated-like protein
MRRVFIGCFMFAGLIGGKAQIVINEVMPKPGPSETSAEDQSMYVCNQLTYGREYVELYNTDPCDSVDVSCFIIAGATGSINYGSYGIPQGTKIPPQGFLVIGGPLVPGVDLVINSSCGSSFLCGANRWYLENTTGWVGLYRPDGTVEDAVFWTFGATSSSAALSTHSNFNYLPCSPVSCFSGVLKKPNEMILNSEIFWAGWLDAGVMIDMTFSRIPDGGNWERNKPATPADCNDICNPSGSNIILDSVVVQEIECGGPNTGSITVYVTGVAPYQYALNGGTPVASSNNWYEFTGLPAGNYIITVSDANNCGQLVIEITLDDPGTIDVDFEGTPLSGCEPLDVSFFDLSSDPSIVSWNWNFGDGSTSSIQNPVHTYQQEGLYSVSLLVTDNMNCQSSLTLNNYIHVFAQPEADFWTVPEFGKTYDPTLTFFSNTVADIWLWNFGDGTTDNNPPPVVHTYPGVEETYEVSLYVENQYGCKDSVQKNISVVDDILFFPNIITPNGDGANDVLVIPNADKYPGNVLKVYNRWGKVVFEQTNYDNTWDGATLSDGTYFYIFTYLDREYSGSLTLIRQ